MRVSTPAVLLLGASTRVSYCQAEIPVENYNVLCTGTSKEIVVNIRTDKYPEETSWKVTDKCRSDEVIWSVGNYSFGYTDYSHSINVCDGQYDFTIMVSKSKVFV